MKAGSPVAPRTLRRIADSFGAMLVVIFGIGTLVCWGQHARHMGIAGRPAISLETLPLLLADGALPLRLPHWLAAWAWFVGACGCAVLTAAGMRWAFVRICGHLAARAR
ncbi:hypothetical protein BHAOGJBA_1152 [Methylobacterium hispanicum]|uniref:Transmembrane protein n=1 Tax=Methylobacterium hispanicum TaxID=270350 RepID=A0AAV4ZHG8_9HYPH|nr:hypothetical protein [Methylobacterium hispanicum]GJD87647.1 hypothetical protein BHAOGJBA_1152 [Methylobacterium hispanicum]